MNAFIREALTGGIARLQAAGIESARLDARILLCQAIGLSVDGLCSAEAAQVHIGIFESLMARRAAREPLAYITGRKEFWSLEFEVGPGVLIPRPETETLIEEALRRFPDAGAPLRVLDVGTGCGCLIVALLKERPNASGLGIDSSEGALGYARRNVSRHGLDARCGFELVEAQESPGPEIRQGERIARKSWRSDIPQFRDSEWIFDVILANPPYLTDEEFATSRSEIRDHEPRQAFAAGSDGLAAFRIFLPLVAASLSPAGMAFFEIGVGQMDKVTEIAVDAGLEVRLAIPDLSGIPRCLAIGRAGDGSPLAP